MAVVNRDYRFDIQLGEALLAETWCYEMTRGDGRTEVKHDRLALETRRVYVEYEDDPGATGNFKPSGIATTEAVFWMFVLGDPPTIVIGVTTERLKSLGAKAWKENMKGYQRYGSCPTRGVLVPLDAFLS